MQNMVPIWPARTFLFLNFWLGWGVVVGWDGAGPDGERGRDGDRDVDGYGKGQRLETETERQRRSRHRGRYTNTKT